MQRPVGRYGHITDGKMLDQFAVQGDITLAGRKHNQTTLCRSWPIALPFISLSSQAR